MNARRLLAVIIPLFTSLPMRAAPPLYGPANIVFHDFEDGTDGGVWDDLGSGAVSYPNDPTSLLSGKVCRILYSPGAGPSSSDQNIIWDSGADHWRYNRTIWFKGNLVLPSTLSDGVTPKTQQQKDDRRKLIDLFNGTGCRLLLEQSSEDLVYVAGDGMTGTYHEDIYTANTGITLAFDTKITIEFRMVTNTADDVRDGILDIFVNNPSATPSYSVTSGLGWITEHYGGGTYFNSFRFGTQLTTYPGFPGYSEYRYWDNCALSTQRIGQ